MGEKEHITEELKISRNKTMEKTSEIMKIKLQYSELETEHHNTKEQLKYLTEKLEEKHREKDKPKTDIVEQIQKNDLEEKIMDLNKKIKDQEEKEETFQKIMNEHQLVKNKLEKCEIELKSKEELLENTKCMLAYSENRIAKIEEFVNSQKQRISSLEEKLQESEQDKIDLAEKLKMVEQDDTMKRVMEELQSQNQLEKRRLSKEKEKADKYSAEIVKLESEIESLKSVHYLDSQKMKILIGSLEQEVKNERQCLKEELTRNIKLKKDLEEEISCRQMQQQELENQATKSRKERQKMNEDRKKIFHLTETLEMEKEKREEYERKLNTETRKQNLGLNLKEKVNDLEGDISMLPKRNCILEDKLAKSQNKLGDFEDISAENRDLQEAILKKDLIIEDLERQIGNMVQEGDIKMKQTLEKMRMGYEIMARSAVSTKLRKMNEYLNDKFKRQEDLDNERENVAKGIQIDLEERLSNSVSEVHHVKDKLRKIEQEYKALKQHADSKEKQLRAEQLVRRQLEQQVDKLANQQISQRMMRGSSDMFRWSGDMVRGSMDNLGRNSLETPVMSPEIWRERKHQSSNSLYFK